MVQQGTLVEQAGVGCAMAISGGPAGCSLPVQLTWVSSRPWACMVVAWFFVPCPASVRRGVRQLCTASSCLLLCCMRLSVHAAVSGHVCPSAANWGSQESARDDNRRVGTSCGVDLRPLHKSGPCVARRKQPKGLVTKRSRSSLFSLGCLAPSVHNLPAMPPVVSRPEDFAQWERLLLQRTLDKVTPSAPAPAL